MVRVRSQSEPVRGPGPLTVRARSRSRSVLSPTAPRWEPGELPGQSLPTIGLPLTTPTRRERGSPTIRTAIPSWWSFALESAPVRAGPRPFCKRCRTFKGESPPPGGCSGLFCKRSGVLKGIPPLRKRYNACEVWYRCETGGIAVKTDPVARAPRPPGRRESHWGTLAALGQVSPHWGRLLTCPNDPLPTPNAPCLPQMHCRLP